MYLLITYREIALLKNTSRIILILIASLTLIGMAGCGEEEMIAQDGDIVKVDYTGTLLDGTEFDTSAGREPLEFTMGEGQMIVGFEEAVRGMKVGDYKKVTIPADKAYGPTNEELILEFPIEQVPEDVDPVVGGKLYIQQENGSSVTVTIVEVTDTTIKVDANPELAGKDLIFKIELVEIVRD